jgi:hypothetical protein
MADTLTHSLVRTHGQTAVLIRCLSPTFDDWDGFSPSASSYDLHLVKALFSGISEKEMRNLVGRGIDASRKATLGEDIRVLPDREGQGDLLLTVPGAEALVVSGSGSNWTVSVASPDAPVSVDYPIRFVAGGVALTGLDRSEYQVWAVVEEARTSHPFANLTKNTLYLREAVGR